MAAKASRSMADEMAYQSQGHPVDREIAKESIPRAKLLQKELRWLPMVAAQVRNYVLICVHRNLCGGTLS